MNLWPSWLVSFAAFLGENSLKAIPLILLLMLLQPLLKRWFAPQNLLLFWAIPLIRLFWPDHLLSMESGRLVPVFFWPPLPVLHPFWLGDALVAVWIVGFVAMVLGLAIQSGRCHERVARWRGCTESRLLVLLEDAREALRVRTPIALVVHPEIAMPALYGFLRPRILLPKAVARDFSDAELRCILEHEVAHVAQKDISSKWLMSLLLALHWFNPLVWWLVSRCAEASEYSCDACVSRRQKNYGEVMVRLAAMASVRPWAVGMAGIVEKRSTVKERIMLLQKNYGRLNTVWSRVLMGVLFAIFLRAPFQLRAAPATPEAAETASATVADNWLPLMDSGRYAESYDGFCVIAKAALPRDKWVEQSKQVRDPLGKLVSRKLDSKQYLTALPEGLKGQFVILQYQADYANLNATETVTTTLDKDGQWRVAGYLIRPR